MSAPATHGVAVMVRRARDARAPLHTQHAAFTVLVERFEAMAFATALRACGDVEGARDASQEAFLAAWRLLPRLREPEAFGGWLKRLVRTQCARARRRRSVPTGIRESAHAEVPEIACDPAELVSRREEARLILGAMHDLPERERQAVTLVYYLGESLGTVARVLGTSVGSAGKCVYTARLRLRRTMPRSIAEPFLAVAPTPAFARRVSAGVFDEFVGEYRFARRPGHVAVLRRERDALWSYAGGQRNRLASRKPDVLAPVEFDGEGRFRRDRSGRITGFIYYEFGRRMGVALKTKWPEAPLSV